jgi:hypothetical protein
LLLDLPAMDSLFSIVYLFHLFHSKIMIARWHGGVGGSGFGSKFQKIDLAAFSRKGVPEMDGKLSDSKSGLGPYNRKFLVILLFGFLYVGAGSMPGLDGGVIIGVCFLVTGGLAITWRTHGGYFLHSKASDPDLRILFLPRIGGMLILVYTRF